MRTLHTTNLRPHPRSYFSTRSITQRRRLFGGCRVYLKQTWVNPTPLWKPLFEIYYAKINEGFYISLLWVRFQKTHLQPVRDNSLFKGRTCRYWQRFSTKLKPVSAVKNNILAFYHCRETVDIWWRSSSSQCPLLYELLVKKTKPIFNSSSPQSTGPGYTYYRNRLITSILHSTPIMVVVWLGDLATFSPSYTFPLRYLYPIAF